MDLKRQFSKGFNTNSELHAFIDSLFDDDVDLIPGSDDNFIAYITTFVFFLRAFVSKRFRVISLLIFYLDPAQAAGEGFQCFFRGCFFAHGW